MGNYKIYMHLNKINGKRYYGATAQLLERRFKKGIGYNSNARFRADIKKHGWNNFEHYIIAENLTKETAEALEQILIKELETQTKGYNVLAGGNLPTDSTVKKLSKRIVCVETGIEYDSISEAERQLNIDRGSISHALRQDDRTTAAHLHWRYADNEYR